MNATPRLVLPYLAAAQAQKHVTHNEALLILDALIQLAVISRSLATPPGLPVEGDRYCIAAAPTGAWSGKALQIAVFQDGAWIFYAPKNGWLCWVITETKLIAYNGTIWADVSSSSAASLFGINATADTTNRLSVASDAVLFSHNGTDQRIKINKAASTNTASVLFQDGFSGRAEMGLAGSDDFSFKVSADGTSWSTALTINKTTGSVSFPNTTFGASSGRETLTANRIYYVRTDGSDSNNGLANTSGGAFLTIQKAVDTTAAIDLGIYDVTIQLANATYTAGALVKAPWVGSGNVTLRGDPTTPANVTISITNANCITVQSNGRLNISGLKLQTTTGGNCLDATMGGSISFSGQMNFGACASTHLSASSGGRINNIGGANYTISGSVPYHIYSQQQGGVVLASITITLAATPAFSGSFATVTNLGFFRSAGVTYSGSATGLRYQAMVNSVVQTDGAGATALPGSTAGTTSTGGQYL